MQLKITYAFSAKGEFLGVSVTDGKAKAEWFAAEISQASKKLKVLHTEKLGNK